MMASWLIFWRFCRDKGGDISDKNLITTAYVNHTKFYTEPNKI